MTGANKVSGHDQWRWRERRCSETRGRVGQLGFDKLKFTTKEDILASLPKTWKMRGLLTGLVVAGIGIVSGTALADSATHPQVGIERSATASGFVNLPVPTASGRTVTANQTPVKGDVVTLVDGQLGKDYGPVFNNGVKNGAYKMDLGSVQPVAAITSWSFNLNNTRGAQKIALYGSTSSTDPGWDLSKLTPLGTIDSGDTTVNYTAASLRAPLGQSLGKFRWIVWSLSLLNESGGGENTAFQELAVELGVNERTIPAESVSNQYLQLIPADKKLDPAWVKSLYERGEKDVYSSDAAMQHIGMPVGGLFAGTVYLSGDGRLWHWHIFNEESYGIAPGNFVFEGRERRDYHGSHYAYPLKPVSPFKQGFGIRANGKEVTLDRNGFKDVTFRGEYPRAIVSFNDSDLPVSAQLEAFSPFVPLNADDSELPATVMQYTVKNEGSVALDLELFGFMENAACLLSRDVQSGTLHNRVVNEAGWVGVECSVESREETPAETKAREDIVFERFDAGAAERWTGQGSAFATGPFGRDGVGLVNTLSTKQKEGEPKQPRYNLETGRLTSLPFKIERPYITANVAGEFNPHQCGIFVIVDGEVVAQATGNYRKTLSPVTIDVSQYQGKEAVFEIRDDVVSSHQHIHNPAGIVVDDIVFTDTPASGFGQLDALPDYGTMTLALLGDGESDASNAVDENQPEATGELGESLVGEVSSFVRLASGEEATFTFVVSWYFPNYSNASMPREAAGRHYASRFHSSTEVTSYLVENSERLFAETRQWVDTWLNSSLPYWFLDRTMANTSTLATTTSQRFEDGRFWGWEGVSSCSGTCSHVWQYAQAVSRLFPSIERRTRDESDFGIGFSSIGGIGHRINMTGGLVAEDGQLGRILCVYREHQMSADNTFLERMWPRVKKGMDYIIAKDTDLNGVIDGSYRNTLDGMWFGRISWSMTQYVAALRAVEAMANEMGDTAYAKRCKDLADQGSKAVDALFNGEYFIQDKGDKPDSFGHGYGCFIDQVFGQSWAHWVGLGHIIDVEKQRSALRAIYRYNFITDIGPFREAFRNGRIYGLTGDAGLLMCTWPKEPMGKGENHIYFYEFMTGFEWQAASHMIFEGIDEPDLLEKGLIVSRAIHDRYRAELRNPYNEIECGDHYARAMASYGAYLAMCGYQYHGPKGELSFAPRLTPEDFRAAFTTAEGWGSFTQRVINGRQSTEIDLRYGNLELKQLSVGQVKGTKAGGASVKVDGKPVASAFNLEEGFYVVSFDTPVRLNAGQRLEVAF
jgi:uncharacterized protein (DUF608 family)